MRILEESIIEKLIRLQPEGVRQKQLTPDQLQIVYRQNWFNLWVPEELGGMGSTFDQGLKFLYELAYCDGGLAWTVTLCSGANMFVGFLEPEVRASIWKDKYVCFGGSGQASGRAEIIDGGFEITGFWRYATGAPHLTHFTLNAWLYRDGEPVLDNSNTHQFRSFFVSRAQVKIHEDWNTFGLECTASHSFSLENIFVPQAHSFQLTRESVKVDSDTYKIPFVTFAELTLLVNYLGMYKRFIELLEQHLAQKKNEAVDTQLRERLETLCRYKEAADQHVDWVWMVAGKVQSNLGADQEPKLEEWQQQIAWKAREIVAQIRCRAADAMPMGGIKAAQYDEELNRVFRHLFTATQHALLSK